MTPSSSSAASSGWWRDAVIYQIYIRSFADSNGDGIGDLAGIRSRLSYLSALGVDAIWITPFYPSPMADGGYDVADYCDVDPLLGSLSDFEALLHDLHDSGLRMIVDLVPNHTSDHHAWFRAALAAGAGSPERERYIFRSGRGPQGDLPPTDWQSVFGGPAWHRVDDGDWYLHLFAPEQPDLNWDHPDVPAKFLDVLRFWLDLGVDGFRIDVANGLMKDPAYPDLGEQATELLAAPQGANHPFSDRDAVHEVYRSWRKLLDSYDGQRIAVAEAWVSTPERMAMYVRPDELHQSFNFAYLKAPWSASELRQVIQESTAATASVGATTTWVLSNHDVVRHVTRFGDGEIGRRRARSALLLMLALPGSSYLYQGEELGLPEVLDLPEDALQDPTWFRSGKTVRGRDGCRVPLPWTTDGPSLGFGKGSSWLPQPTSWSDLAVEAQTGRDDSMLEFYRSALKLRRDIPALGEGAMTWLELSDDVLAFERRNGSESVLCIVNLDAEALVLPPHAEVLLASDNPDTNGRLAIDTCAWLRL